MLRSVVLTSFILITFLGCGSSSSPVVNDSPRSVLPPDNSSELIGTEDHPCDSSGGCFNDLVCEDGICVAPPVVDSGSSDGSSTGEVVDSGSSDGSSDGSSTGELMDSGSLDGSSDGSSTGGIVDSGSSDGNSDGSSTGGIVDSGSSDGNSDGSSTGDELDAGPTDCITGQNETAPADGLFRYVDNASFDNVDSCEDGPLDWAINPLQSTNYSLRYDGEARGNIMEVDRSIMTGSGHWAFMQQSKELFVNNCSELVLSGEVNPIFQSLNSPGSTQGEFPVHVRVIYEDVLGDRYMYQVGVHYKGTVQAGWLPPETDNWGYPGCPAGPCAAYETLKVNEGEWYTLPALDVMSITPQPHKLLSFRLGSSGHRFTAKFDNVQLTGSDAETCGTENETEATSTTDAGITDPQSQMDAGVASSVTDAGTEPDTTDAGIDDNSEVMSANSETSKLAVSQNHACAIDATGSLKCWRFVGNLSVGWESEALDLQNGNGIYASVSVGWMYIHAISTTGALQAWDSNGSEVTLETMQTSQIWNAVRVNPFPSDNAVPMACGIHSDWTELMCWGEPQYAMTYTVPTDDVWMDLDISGQTACALNASHEISCWNVANPSVDAISPEASGLDWTSISYGGTQICGLDDMGNVDCWNASNFTPASSSTHELLGWRSLALGDGFRACGVRDGQMQCWEYRNNVDQEALPESFGLPDNAVHVVMQSNRVCAILETGALFCWGWEYDVASSPYLVSLPTLDGLTVVP